jgi:hypothetical protein
MGQLYHSLSYEASTSEAYISLFEFYKICIELGCLAEAFCMLSPVVIV